MTSAAYKAFEHAIQDSIDLLNHFDALNSHPPPPEAEVLKRASLVMALAALETYVEDRIVEASEMIAGRSDGGGMLVDFYQASLEQDLKSFHSPNSVKVKAIFSKYLDLDVTSGWTWANYDPVKARRELNRISQVRGDIAHRSLRPVKGKPSPHAVTREGLRKALRFIMDLVEATDRFIDSELRK